MNAEEARKLREEKLNKQKFAGSAIAPNPAQMTLKWGFFNEEVAVEGGRKALLPSGAFQYQVKKDDGSWERHKLPQKKFAIAIIDHSFIQINGSEFEGQRMVRSYWSNEMRMSDTMTNPFILSVKGSVKDEKPKRYVGSYKELKSDYDIKGRMHIIYGLTPTGTLIKLALPYYSYTLGSEGFKTHGDTLLDADRKSTSGGMMNCWLTYDGFHELTTGKTIYTAPKFKFEEKLTDEIIIKIAEVSDVLDSWYNEYHESNLSYMDKITGGRTPDDSYQGKSSHGSESQVSPSNDDDNSGWEEDDIPF